jgi:hypothetical protein
MIISHTIYHSFVLPCTTYKLENYIQFFWASFVYINQIIHEISLQYPPLHKWLNNLTCFRTLSNHFLNPPIDLSNTNNTSILSLKCSIHGQLLETFLVAYPFSHPQSVSFVGPLTPMCMFGHISCLVGDIQHLMI